MPEQLPAKAALRQRVLARRAGLSTKTRSAAGVAVAHRAMTLPEVAGAGTVAAYWALEDEIPTAPLLAALLARGAQVLLPVLLEDAGLDWRRYDGTGSVGAGLRGTKQPAGPNVDPSLADVVVVPGLAFDVAGRRLGRGGGSFDRTLALLAPATPKIGLAFDEDVVDEVPTAAHDVHVAIVVTPTRVIRA